MSQHPYIFEFPIKVRDYEVDGQGIVNNANYLHYLEHTRHEFCEYVGLTWRRMNEMGLMPVVRKVEIEYINSLHMGETMVSKLWLERKGPRFIFHQDIFTTEGLHIVTANVTVVSVVNGRPSRGEVLAETFREYLD